MLRKTFTLNLNSARRVLSGASFLLGVALLAIASPSNAQSDVNHCQTYGGGQGWSWSLVDNKDVTGDGVVEEYVDFFHYSIGRLTGQIDHSNSSFDRVARTATFRGAGRFNSTQIIFRAEVAKSGGIYGAGITYIYIYSDLNRNGTLNSGEPLLRTLRLNALYTDLYFDPNLKKRR